MKSYTNSEIGKPGQKSGKVNPVVPPGTNDPTRKVQPEIRLLKRILQVIPPKFVTI